MSINDIINEALTLKPQERYMIIENLVKSLNQPNSDIDKLWIEESSKRVEAIKNGQLQTVSYEDVFASMTLEFSALAQQELEDARAYYNFTGGV